MYERYEMDSFMNVFVCDGNDSLSGKLNCSFSSIIQLTCDLPFPNEIIVVPRDHTQHAGKPTAQVTLDVKSFTQDESIKLQHRDKLKS